MARLGALTLLLLLALAAPAHAGGTLFTRLAYEQIGGASLAGDRVVWAAIADDREGLDLHRTSFDGRSDSVTNARIPTIGLSGSSPSIAFDASPVVLAATVHVVYCAPDCKYQNYDTAYSRTLSGPPGGPLAELERCGEGHRGPGYSSEPVQVRVDGQVVAHRSPCRQEVVVTDTAAGGEPVRFRAPAYEPFALAGGFLAFREGSELVLREWRSGAERLRIPDVLGFDVQADGRVAYTVQRGTARPVLWASPDSPTPSEVAPDSAGGPRIAQDRIAFARPAGGVTVRTVGGEPVGVSPRARLGDFDGTRVAWATLPCSMLAIATWDLGGEPPAFSEGPCPLAALRSRRLRGRVEPPPTRDWVPVKVECPPEPPVGCLGALELLARDSRRPPQRTDLVGFGHSSYFLPPGGRATARINIRPGELCAVLGNARRPILESRGFGTYGGPPPRAKRRRVVLSGLDGAIADCRRR